MLVHDRVDHGTLIDINVTSVSPKFHPKLKMAS